MIPHAPFGRPHPQQPTLYDPRFEHDNCGVGFIARIDGNPTHSIVSDAITVLLNLEHRGAVNADGVTGDGAGLLLQMPDHFLRRELVQSGMKLPAPGEYAVAMVFMPRDKKDSDNCARILEDTIDGEGLEVLGWREVPVETTEIGQLARDSQPYVRQLFIGLGSHAAADFERKLYVARRIVEKTVESKGIGQFYIVSMSSKTVNYKGFMNGKELPKYYVDLRDPDFKCTFSIIHQRYSTNTFPSWELAQPFRFCAHNGEINTLSGNINRMRTREAQLASDLFGDDIEKLLPIIQAGGSDSAVFDNVLELLVLGGRSLAHSMMMMIPEAWGDKYVMGDDKRAFYEYHSTIMEPWDGPAAMVATDGRFIGGTLDRNGLRPCRYTITKDGVVLMASEVGVVEFADDRIKAHGRLQPGKMFLLDLEQNRIIPDNVIKAQVSRQRPYRHWVKNNRIELRGLMLPAELPQEDPAELRVKQHAFGYTEEDLKMVLAPMGARGQEAVGSMGEDTPLAVLSKKPKLLFNYFKQLFAQVTNPAIDPLREELVMSLMKYSGRELNLLDETPEHCRQLKLQHPILTPQDMSRLRSASHSHISVGEIDMLFPVNGDGAALKTALDGCFEKAVKLIEEGASFIILTDKNMGREMAPIPAILASAGLHHYLIKNKLRSKAAILVESGEAREIMHFALLIGYGADAICPHVAFSTIRYLSENGVYEKPSDPEVAVDAYITAIKKGLMKTMSRIGISTIRSYYGAHIFEAVGLHPDLVDEYFSGTTSRIGGIGLDEIAIETRMRYEQAFINGGENTEPLEHGGYYHVSASGQKHLWDPEAISTFQQAIRSGDYSLFKKFSKIIDDQSDQYVTLRSMLRFKKTTPIPIEEVEPEEEIVKRFATSAMSMGSISKEAHETLAIAMNRIKGRSNSGEGGEDEVRFTPLPNGDSKRSEIKQIASGRFGVTTHYLVNASELQIKVAQGAKPGEGGQLPGHKVSKEIAKIRHSTPGVTLISPPPHHDIYSIEDLAQLIFDLKEANPKAKVSVKLVSEAGVGTIAAGVVKGKADTVVISGHDGGTGASPITSIKHAGLPWELGLAETQQTLVMNGLRDNMRIHADGQMRTGRDLAIGALLGADEFGFGTMALVSVGCILLRKCHLNACSVGVATQDPNLRKNFAGAPEHTVNMMLFLARELREYMAELGFRTFDEMVGRSDLLEVNPDIDHYKAKTIDFSRILAYAGADVPREQVYQSNKELVTVPSASLELAIIEAAKPALENGEKVTISYPIRNIHRTIGAQLSGEIARRYGGAGLPDSTVTILLKGSAGQSLGAFLMPGVTIRLEGNANDYLGKGMSGGRVIVVPPKNTTFEPSENIIAGNTILYGATGGEVYLNGKAGERFCVRNSGAVVVVEGVGDHGCEYMTGGMVVCLGETGNNFAAGMSGGIAYVYDTTEQFDTRCNLSMVDIESVTSVEDEVVLKKLIENYYKHTKSARAKAILDDWDSSLPLFAKVMPIDYRESLKRMQIEEDTDKDTLSASEEVFLPPYIEHRRKNPPKRPVDERLKDYNEVEQMLSKRDAEIQASRCRDCGVPYCHAFGCPVNNQIPDWNMLAAGKSWKQANELLHLTNNFPEVTGRVCPAPCEAACTLAINIPAVSIRHVELQIVERAFKKGWIAPQPALVKTGQSVAVIGSGPAGLAAAQQLARQGHAVTVYEKDDRIGGYLRYGIPDFKLEKWVIDRRMDQMCEEGVVFETGVNAGVDISPRYLENHFDAMVITAGARVPRDLDIPGRTLKGIHFAMELLEQQNRAVAGDTIPKSKLISAKGKKVLVIGGGDTGSDCVGTSNRHGATSVTQVEILPQPPEDRAEDNPWPEWPRILRTSSSHEEGCERLWGVMAKEFIGKNGKLKKVKFVNLEWYRENGRFTFKEVPGSEFEIEADLVVFAMGFLHVEQGPLVTDLGIDTDNRGNIVVDDDYMTSHEGVFAAGDSVLGASLVVRAIAQGRKAAEGVGKYLAAVTEKQAVSS